MAEHAEAFKTRVSFSVAFRDRKWRVIFIDGVKSELATFSDLFDALEWIKDLYRTAGVHFCAEYDFNERNKI